MKRSSIVGVNDHKKYGDKSDEEYQKIINDWKPIFRDETRKKIIPPSRI